MRIKQLTLLATLAMLSLCLPKLPADAVTYQCTVTIPDSGITWNGTQNSDVVCILGDNNIVNLLGGDDIVVDDGVGNTINLGDGNDIYDGALASGGIVDGGLGNDTIQGTPGIDEILGGDGDDSLVGGDGDDVLNGGPGADNLGGDAGSDDLFGESGIDSITGGPADDLVVGGDGVDMLDGGDGLNVCDFTIGEIQTTTCRYDDVAPNIVSLTLNKSSVDVGTSNGLLQATVRATDQTGVLGVTVECTVGSTLVARTTISINSTTYNFLELVTGYQSPDLPLSGSVKDVQLTFPLTVAYGAIPGAATCLVTAIDDLLHHSDAKALGNFTVTRSGSGWDDVAPNIVSLTLNKSSVDVGTSNGLLQATVRATDQTGVLGVTVECTVGSTLVARTTISINSTTYNFLELVTGYQSPDLPLSGSVKDVQLTFPLTVAYGAIPGAATCLVTAIDDLLHHSDAKALGNFTVTRSGSGWDDVAPNIVSLTLNKSSVDVGTSNGLLQATVRATDQTGVLGVTVECTVGSTLVARTTISINSTTYNFLELVTGYQSPDLPLSGSVKDVQLTFPLTVAYGAIPGAATCLVTAIDDLLHHSDAKALGNFSLFRTPPGQPSAPSQFSGIATSRSTITLNWSSPADLGSPALNNFIVRYSTDGNSWKELMGGVTSQNTMNISNLNADTMYWFKVRGDNGGTAGLDENFMNLAWSVINLRTLPAEIPTAPRGLQISNISSSGFNVTWAAPLTNGGSAITDFTVEISRDAGATWKSVKTKTSNSSSFRVTGAAPGTKYLVRVAAVNKVGSSPFATGTLTTLAGPPTSPLDLLLGSVSASTVRLTWALPQTNGGSPLTDYQVQFSRDGVTYKQIPHKPFLTRGFTAKSLAAGTKYWFRVIARNKLGSGTPSSAVSVITDGNAPSAPTGLSVQSRTNSVQLGWRQAVVSGGSPVRNYVVEYSLDGATWTAVPKRVSTSSSLNVTGLRAKTKYRFRVFAINDVGSSSASRVLTVSTK